jgi:hypothetical protein
MGAIVNPDWQLEHGLQQPITPIGGSLVRINGVGGRPAKLVQITIRAMGYNLRLRRPLCGRAVPFRCYHSLYNLFSAA